MKHLSTVIGICAVLLPIARISAGPAEDLNLPVPNFDTPLPSSTKPSGPPLDKARFNKPVYNPETKSYFEYYFPEPNLSYNSEMQYNWEVAEEIAKSRVFHGVRGRLAVVKTKETNQFIVEKLQPETGAWIGLEYLCDNRTLRWVTGELWPLSGYQNWAKHWNREGANAASTTPSGCLTHYNWMGVHYWGPEGGFKWNANGTGKRFGWMIIEYPTGKP